MASFTVTWNGTYEGLPPDSEDAKDGAGRIRSFKLAVRERLAIDHSIAGDAHDGKHTKVTLRPQASIGVLDADDVALWAAATAKTSLRFKNEDADDLVVVTLASATRMLFQQTTAPIGWTKDTTATFNDVALRVVTGSVVNGGSTLFSSVFGAGKVTAGHIVTTDEMPIHTHPINVDTVGAGTSVVSGKGLGVNAAFSATQPSGGDQPHTHDLSLDLKFCDCIVAALD